MPTITKRADWPKDVPSDHRLAMETLLRDPGLVVGGRIRAEAWHSVCQSAQHHLAMLSPGALDLLSAIVTASDGRTLSDARSLLIDALAGRVWASDLPCPAYVPHQPSKPPRSDSKRRSARNGAKVPATGKIAPGGRKQAARRTLPATLPDPYVIEGDQAGLKLAYDNNSASLFGLPLLAIDRRDYRRGKAWKVSCRWLLMKEDPAVDVFYIPKKYIGPKYRAMLYAAIKQLIICYLTPPAGDPLHPADSQVPK